MSPLTGISGLYGIGLVYGGPVVLVWGWVLASILTTCVSLALSELSSAFPVSGGLYFWAFMLGRQTGPFASWCVGWTNFLGQIALVAADTFSCVQLFLSFLYLVSLDSSGSGYYPSNALQLYLFGGLLLIFAIINVQPLSVVGRLSELGALFNLLGTIVWTSERLCHNHEKQPKFRDLKRHVHLLVGPIARFALSGISGLPFLIALTLCIQDVGQLTDSDNGFDGINIVAQLLWQAYKTRFSTGIASLSLFAIPLGANFISALYSITSASRMLFGLSRDQAIPFSTTWQKVDESSGAPHCAVWGVTGASFILGLPLLNGVTAFSATTSIACAGLALTYSLPILLRILFRSNYLEAGPFTLGRWSIPVGVVACIQAGTKAFMHEYTQLNVKKR
ncbi:hypothetical protein WJX79_005294 [Trebouxia sp. C0005]